MVHIPAAAAAPPWTVGCRSFRRPVHLTASGVASQLNSQPRHIRQLACGHRPNLRRDPPRAGFRPRSSSVHAGNHDLDAFCIALTFSMNDPSCPSPSQALRTVSQKRAHACVADSVHWCTNQTMRASHSAQTPIRTHRPRQTRTARAGVCAHLRARAGEGTRARTHALQGVQAYIREFKRRCKRCRSDGAD